MKPSLIRLQPDYGECDGSPDQPHYCAAVPRGYEEGQEQPNYGVHEFKSSLVRLGYTHPRLRPQLRSVLRHVEARSRRRLDEVAGEPGRMREILRVKDEESIEDRYTPQRAVQRLVDEVGEVEASGMINYVANFTGKRYFERMQEELVKTQET